MSADYGDCTVVRGEDGRPVVTRADQTIGIAAGLLEEASGAWIATDADGRLVLAGQVRYTPVRFAEQGRVVVCERVGEFDEPR